MVRRAQQLVTALGFSSSKQPYVISCGTVPDCVVDAAIAVHIAVPVTDCPLYPGETEIDYLRDLDPGIHEPEDFDALFDWEHRVCTELWAAGFVWEHDQDSVRIWRSKAWHKVHPALL